MSYWNNISYQEIKRAQYANGNVVVEFENGDVIEVPSKTIVCTEFTNIEWDNLKYTPYEITIPANPNELEISWDKLRVITDKRFRDYLAEISDEQSKLIGMKIKRLRERNRLLINELAEGADVTPQTISLIEKGKMNLRFSILRKILTTMGYSLKDLSIQELQFETEIEERSLNYLIKRLGSVNIDENLLINKIIPSDLIIALNKKDTNDQTLILDKIASFVSEIFGWSLNDIWSRSNLQIEPEPGMMAFFKKPSYARENQVKAYSHYAYYLAKVVLKAVPQRRQINYPNSIEDFKMQYFRTYNELDFSSLIEFTWGLGVCVLPLNDPGVFHGASWNIEGRHVVVLKQNTQSHARWIFDLLHELYHVFVHLDEANTAVVELEELNPFSDDDSIEELEANSFANQVVFGTRAEKLAEKCVISAKGDMKNLSKAVMDVAKHENIRQDFLSNYLAFRLAFQGENWWGAATRIQILEPNPFIIASSALMRQLSVQELSSMEYNLLLRAMAFY